MRTHFIVSLSLIVFTGCYGSYEPPVGMTTTDATGTKPVGTTGGNTTPSPVDNDQDNDGHDSVASGGDDCVDTDPTIHPGAAEADGCDGVDSDCDGADRSADPNARTGAPGASECDGVDQDGDHFLDVDGNGDVVDCDDNETTGAHTFPGAAEHESSSLCMEDADEDGYGNMTPNANVTAGTDCDDVEPLAFPGNPEDCDGIDNDCSSEVDDKDADADGHVDDTCAAYTGSDPIDDCDDTNEDAHPGALEISNDGIDQDCDGNDLMTADPDSDGDGSVDSLDCDDVDATVYPGATEVANDDIDQDCDGFDRIDVDCDGADAIVDCDDEDPERSPQFVEVMNDGIDNDCNPATLDAAADPDSDWDGTVDSQDCDDTDPLIHPGATEVADDGIDQDCDGSDLVTVIEPDPCTGGYSWAHGTFTGPADAVIVSISGERVGTTNGDDYISWSVWTTGTPIDMVVTNSANVAEFSFERCVDDAADWKASVSYTLPNVADVQYDCMNDAFTGTWSIDFNGDIQTVTVSSHASDTGCDAAW